MKKTAATLDGLYNLVANEEDARACRDIPDSACREVPHNFFVVLASLVLTKLGDILINPKTTLAWIMGALGAPPTLTAWLVPIRESGALIPQLAIGAWVRHSPRRKGFWVAGSLAQGLCIGCIALVALSLQGMVAGLSIIGLLVLFSVARGFCSVAAKDVQGKCIPKGRRGRLSGLATTLSGIATIILVVSLFWGNKHPGVGFYALLLVSPPVYGWSRRWCSAPWRSTPARPAVVAMACARPGPTQPDAHRCPLPALRDHPRPAAVLGPVGAVPGHAGPAI